MEMERVQSRLISGADASTKVLLVDDSPSNLLALKSLLEPLGSQCVEALSGYDALDRLKSEDFAVILLDIVMPEISGFETAGLIRNDPRSSRTPIIFLTSHDLDRPWLEEAYRMGAVDVLSKPLIPEVLRAKVKGFIELFEDRQATKREAEQLRLLVQGTNDYAIFMLDLDGYVISWNSGAERLKGYRSDEIIGRHISTFYPAEALERSWPQHELEVARSEGRFEDEGWRVRKDGSMFWANVVLTAIRDEHGVLRGFSKITRDLTARRLHEENLRQSEERFRLLVDGVKDYALFLLDPQGRVASWNAGAERIKQYRPDEIIGRHFSCFYPPEAIEKAWPEYELRMANAHGRFEDNGWRLRKDGTRFWANVVITALRDDAGDLRGYAKVTRDVTEKKLAEENARRLIEESAARSAAEQDSRRKEEFLATLAHELRNPLAPIRNSLQILKMPEVDPQTALHAREMMERQILHLIRLVDDLLDISRVSRGKIDLRLEPVELSAAVASGIETSLPLIEMRDHRLEFSASPESLMINADSMRLSQVVSNLVANAAKYSDEHGHIWVTTRREQDWAVLRVRDRGIGIAPNMLQRIFEVFVQADPSTHRSQGGLGIGLTLVKNLVELHGGSVEARSDGLGEGSEFVVRFPLTIARRHAPMDAAAESSAVSKMSPLRVLVVDDNRDAAMTLAILLKLEGYAVATANSGVTALDMMPSFQPNIVLLDLGMPGMDGYEVAGKIRSMPGQEKTVLAALTGWGQDGDRRRTAQAGFSHHFVKPVDPIELYRVLVNLGESYASRPCL